MKWSVGLLVIGSILTLYIPDLFFKFQDAVGPNAEIGVRLVEIILQVIRETVMPIGASLAGAAVVIQVLAGSPKTTHDDDTDPR